MGVLGTAESKKSLGVALSLLVLLLSCYGNSFQGAWLYDDFVNIVKNSKVQMTEISWPRLRDALTAGPDFQIVGRPLAYLSFALNYRFGADHPLGYHIVNFFVHWLTSLMLFFLVRDTLRLPSLAGRYASQSIVIAWLATLFWASHPIQATAVTYIVQRMTSLAGFFYVSAIYAYLAGRRASVGKTRRWAYGACAVSTACAMASKENAVLIPYSLLLFELLFFRKLDRRAMGKALLAALGIAVLLLFVGALYANPLKLLAPFSNRSFTMIERLLTQPRVIFIYLSMLAVPMASRLSMLHDVAISKSLLTPWTTLPALLGVLASILLLCWLARRHRLFAFCGLFFFLNHGVESTMLNLDLIYEHRNYVPSMFLFVPLAVATLRALGIFYYQSAFRILIAGCTAMLLFTRAQTTYEYNRVFSSELALWRHVAFVYPNSSLAYNNLGKSYWDIGDFEKAHQSFNKALWFDRFNNIHQKATTYYNFGVYLAEVEKEYIIALSMFEKARDLSDHFLNNWQWIARVLIQEGDFVEAEKILPEALKQWPDDYLLNGLQAINKMKNGECAAAIEFASNAMSAGRIEERVALMVIAQSYWLGGEHATAIDTWQRLLDKEPDNTAALLALAEIQAKMNRMGAARRYLQKLLDLKGIDYLRKAVTFEIKGEYIMPYVPDEVTINQIYREMNLE
jgi:tetratricopeptide (TPR) repeat protein